MTLADIISGSEIDLNKLDVEDSRYRFFPVGVKRVDPDGKDRFFTESFVVKLDEDDLKEAKNLSELKRRISSGTDAEDIKVLQENYDKRKSSFNKKIRSALQDATPEGTEILEIGRPESAQRFFTFDAETGESRARFTGPGPGTRVGDTVKIGDSFSVVDRDALRDRIQGKGRSLAVATPAQAAAISAGGAPKEVIEGPEPNAEDVRKGIIEELGDDPDMGPAYEEQRLEERKAKEAAEKKKKIEDEKVRRGAPSAEREAYGRRRRMSRRLGPLGFLLGTPDRPETVTVGEAEDLERAKRVAAAEAGKRRLTGAAASKTADAAGDAAKAAKTAASASKMGSLMKFLGPIGYGFMAYDLLSREPRRRREILDRRLQMNADIMDRIRQRTVTSQPAVTGEYAAIQDLAQGLPPQQTSIRMTPELQAILGSRAQEVARMGTPIAPSFTEIMARQGRYQ